jgi:hypothetical protein
MHLSARVIVQIAAEKNELGMGHFIQGIGDVHARLMVP